MVDINAGNERRLDRRIYLLGLSRMIRAMGRTSSFLFLPIVLFEIYKISLLQIGIFAGFATLIMALVQYYSGVLTDKIGRRKFLIYVPIPVSVLYWLMAEVVFKRGDLVYLISLWYLTIFFNALQFPAIQATVADLTRLSQRLTAYTIVRLMVNVGAAIGPIIGAFIGTINLGYIFIITSIATLIELFILIFVKETHSRNSSLKISKVNKKIFSDRFLMVFAIVGLLFSFLLRQRGTTLTIFIFGFKGISLIELGLIYSLNGLLVVALQYPIYKLIVSKLTYLHWRAIGSLIYSFSFLLIAILTGFVGYLLIMGILTVGEDFVSPTTETIITSIASEESRGSYIGFYNMVTSIGNFAGSIFGLWLLGIFISVPTDFWIIISTSMLIVAILYIFMVPWYSKYHSDKSLPGEASS